jgi:hypothetical protein
MPEVGEKAMLFGMEARSTTPEDMRRRLLADIEKWAGSSKRPDSKSNKAKEPIP